MALEMTRYIYIDKLLDKKNKGLIKVVTGLSRCGKSYLLFNTFYEYLAKHGAGEFHIIEIPLQDRGYKRLNDSDAFMEYVRGRIEDDDMYYIFIDDLQLANDYREIINALLRRENVDIYISGNDTEFLKKIVKEYPENIVEIFVNPLCYRELVTIQSRDKALENMIKYGGMPMVSWMNSNEEKKTYLYKVLSTKFMPEIVDKYNVKNISEFVELIRTLAKEIGNLTNPLKLVSVLKEKNIHLTDKTIKKFLGFLEEEYFVHKVLRYDIKKKKLINTPVKYYFADVGLANAYLDFENIDEEGIVENLIFNELKLRGYDVTMGVYELNYKEDGKNKKKQLEIDFIATKEDRKYYIQSAFTKSSLEKHKNLLYIKDSFKKIIVTGEKQSSKYDEYGIMTIGLREFLGVEKSLEL